MVSNLTPPKKKEGKSPLLQPIGITGDRQLVFGERRLKTHLGIQ